MSNTIFTVEIQGQESSEHSTYFDQEVALNSFYNAVADEMDSAKNSNNQPKCVWLYVLDSTLLCFDGEVIINRNAQQFGKPELKQLGKNTFVNSAISCPIYLGKAI